MTCPNCGWYIRGGERVCPNCGAALPTSETVRICSFCQAEVKGQVSLCPICGAALGSDTVEAAAGKEVAAAGPPEAEGAPPAEAKAAGAKKGRQARVCPRCKAELKGRVGICPVCGEWLISSTAPKPPAMERPMANSLRPISPNWPFDDPTPPEKGKRYVKTPKAPAKAAKGPQAPAEPPKGQRQPAAEPPKAAGAAAVRPLGATMRPPETRAPEPRPATKPTADRPPEIKPWYVLHSTPESRPPLPPRASVERRVEPARGLRPQPQAVSRALSLLPWFGLLAGLVLLSVLIYGLAVGGLRLPFVGSLSGGGKGATPTATSGATATPAASATPSTTPTSPATATATPAATAAPRTHVVRPGESLSSIAQQYGVTVAELMAANAISDANSLRAGQELTIPNSAAGTPAAPTLQPGATAAATAAASTPTAAPATTTPAGAAPTSTAFQFAAPNLLSPADGTVYTTAEDILLNWSSVGLLGDDTWYVVKIWTDDPNQPTPATGWTRTTAWRIPASSRPAADAASHTFHWTVTVMRASEGQDPVAVSEVSETRTFEWK